MCSSFTWTSVSKLTTGLNETRCVLHTQGLTSRYM